MENKDKFVKAETEEITIEEDVITQSVVIGPVSGDSVIDNGVDNE